MWQIAFKWSYISNKELCLGCGYPPDIICDLFAEKYENHSLAGETFPCHYSRYNPWMVIAYYDRFRPDKLEDLFDI